MLHKDVHNATEFWIVFEFELFSQVKFKTAIEQRLKKKKKIVYYFYLSDFLIIPL